METAYEKYLLRIKLDKQKILQWINEILKTDGWLASEKDHYDTTWLVKLRDEIVSGHFDSPSSLSTKKRFEEEQQNLMSGWKCPECGLVISPFQSVCPNSPHIKTINNSTTILANHYKQRNINFRN